MRTFAPHAALGLSDDLLDILFTEGWDWFCYAYQFGVPAACHEIYNPRGW